VITHPDITERMGADLARTSPGVQVRESQKMEAVGTLENLDENVRAASRDRDLPAVLPDATRFERCASASPRQGSRS
jgi:hypothetical protein